MKLDIQQGLVEVKGAKAVPYESVRLVLIELDFAGAQCVLQGSEADVPNVTLAYYSGDTRETVIRFPELAGYMVWSVDVTGKQMRVCFVPVR